MKLSKLIRTPSDSNAEEGSMFDRHFSLRTLAELWGCSEDTIRRLAEDEPGIFKIGSGAKQTLKIPESVAKRIYEKRTKA